MELNQTWDGKKIDSFGSCQIFPDIQKQKTSFLVQSKIPNNVFQASNSRIVGLWEYGCFELFLGDVDFYIELNFDSFGNWAGFGFFDVRQKSFDFNFKFEVKKRADQVQIEGEIPFFLKNKGLFVAHSDEYYTSQKLNQFDFHVPREWNPF